MLYVRETQGSLLPRARRTYRVLWHHRYNGCFTWLLLALLLGQSAPLAGPPLGSCTSLGMNLVALGSSAFPRRGPATECPASGARARHLQARRFYLTRQALLLAIYLLCAQLTGKLRKLPTTHITTHHSSLATLHSPLTTHHSLPHHSPLTTHHAPRTTHCPLPIAQASSGSCRPADTSSASAPTACSRRCASGSGATRRSLPLGSPTPSTRSSSVRVRVRVRASNPNPNPSPSPNPNPNPNQAWSSATSRASSHG